MREAFEGDHGRPGVLQKDGRGDAQEIDGGVKGELDGGHGQAEAEKGPGRPRRRQQAAPQQRRKEERRTPHPEGEQRRR